MSSPFSDRIAGLLVPAFALRETGDLGIGDTVSVRAAIDFCAAQKFKVLQLLPINETGGDNSPYNAISSVSLDPVLLRLSPEEVPGLLTEHLDALAHREIREELSGPAVDYARVKRLKLDLLRLAFTHFGKTAKSKEKKALAEFESENAAWLTSYTLFRTLLDRHHGDSRWPIWDTAVRNAIDAEAWAAALPASEREEVAELRAFYTFVQWIAYTQWGRTKAHASTCGVSLLGDIPFGVSRYSADVWARQELFDLKWSGGAPPEKFFQGDPFTSKWGQNWGIPLYPWDTHREEDFAWWRQRVTQTCQIFHSFRIDHVLGFFRVYSFPWTPERNGEFLPLSEEEARKQTGGHLPGFLPRPDDTADDAQLNAADGCELLMMIQEAAGDAIVVAEDLGVVPDYVRPLLLDLNIPGFTIPHFERNEKDRTFKKQEDYPEINLITYATHDHDPLAVLYDNMVKQWSGPEGDEGWREIVRLMHYLGWKAERAPRHFTDELHRRFIEVLLDSPCWLAVLMITDLLGTKQRFNEPGVIGAGNWSQRLDRPLKAYLDDAAYATRIRGCTELIGATGRE